MGDETRLDEPKVDETAVDELVVDKEKNTTPPINISAGQIIL